LRIKLIVWALKIFSGLFIISPSGYIKKITDCQNKL